MADVVDVCTGLELLSDEEGHFVRFEGDQGGSSLLFAYHEQEIYSEKERQEVGLDRWQIEQVEEWFDDHEGM